MSNHSGSRQNNYLLMVMLRKNIFDALDREQSRAVLTALSNVEDGNLGEIYEDIPPSLKFCVYCRDFRDEVKYFSDYGVSLCKECCAENEVDWNDDASS